MFSAAVQYCKRRYTSFIFDCNSTVMELIDVVRVSTEDIVRRFMIVIFVEFVL